MYLSYCNIQCAHICTCLSYCNIKCAHNYMDLCLYHKLQYLCLYHKLQWWCNRIVILSSDNQVIQCMPNQSLIRVSYLMTEYILFPPIPVYSLVSHSSGARSGCFFCDIFFLSFFKFQQCETLPKSLHCMSLKH